jgi:hypothetical protein
MFDTATQLVVGVDLLLSLLHLDALARSKRVNNVKDTDIVILFNPKDLALTAFVAAAMVVVEEQPTTRAGAGWGGTRFSGATIFFHPF